MERGETTRELPTQKSEQPKSREEAAPPPAEAPQQALARPAEPPPTPPPPAPTLEKELPPIESAPPPLTSRDIPKPAPPPAEKKPEPKPEPPRPPQPHAQPQAQPARPAPPQIAPSPLSSLPRNAPSQRQSEPPRSTFVNPADTFAQNTVLDAYLQRVVVQVSRYRFDGAGLSPSDSVVARFTIARNGSLLAVAIVRPSGKPKLDRDAVTAFQQVAPFPPLPAEVPGDSHTFVLTFWPGRAR
jgi:TonB family protein